MQREIEIRHRALLREGDIARSHARAAALALAAESLYVRGAANEWRATLNDLTKGQMARSEVEAAITASRDHGEANHREVMARIDLISRTQIQPLLDLRAQLGGRASLSAEFWMRILTLAGLAIALFKLFQR